MPINQEISIALAREDEFPLVLKLLKDAAHWLHERKIDQWGFLRDGGEDEEIREGILSGNTYLARQGEEVVGTFALYERQSEWDAYIWSQSSDSAAYLHRLAVARGKNGHGVGGKLIAWIEQECRKTGKGLLRLDCVAANERLSRYYADHGFTFLGISHDHRMCQKSLTDAKG